MNIGKNQSLWSLSRRYVLPALLALAALLSAACGKRGPLYLPDETGAQTRTGEPAGSPAPTPPDKASGEDAHQK